MKKLQKKIKVKIEEKKSTITLKLAETKNKKVRKKMKKVQ